MKITSAEFKKSIRGTDEIVYEARPQVAFIGRSNVGKSSLMNCLLNENDLVKSGGTPGKTREINFFLINKSFYFVDLPGYGYAKMSQDDREQMVRMIQWYLMEPAFKRTVVLVLDIKAGPTSMDTDTLQVLGERGQKMIVVANKADSLNQKERSAALKAIAVKMPNVKIIPCSAKTYEGREEIWREILA